ncbi:hypothetical protein K450DRAFT_232101 [Umbelopsis ramanniana AG]|uniref:GIT Spa2 homology (SHD) domain-containing protein n=1 Tax=Umbelopsis ramanniana AG TaxID=1314678 RepID=A0AAD5EEK0_UMBRA|nr:uncharacterized protein K450DRAFT_232101 [Umbelopsis ramanniana AG]KAI8581600.1 hypothetical protein K450DRAFT_232101 [Umbelopsis ramanniana AG]
MSRVRSPPISPSTEDPDQHSQYSRTYSTSSSSRNTHHSRSQSLASSNGRHNSSSVNLEASARVFYHEIKAYIASLLAREAAEGVSPQRAGARGKLTKLSNQQFHELSMDVYDELMRRNADDRMFPFLPVRDDFHPKRNQARQKLATLPKTRFKDLASDVFYEIDHRYPHFQDEEADARPPLPPIPPTANGHMSKNISNAMAQPSQSTNIVPVMGTMNIEVVDVGYKYQGNSPANSPYNSPKPQYARNDNDMNSSPGSLSSRGESFSSKDGRLNGMSNGASAPNSRSPAPTKWDSPPMPKAPVATSTNNNNGESNNFQSLDSLMADLGNMVTKDQTKPPSQRDDMSVKSDSTRNFDAQMDQLKTDYEYKLNAMRQRIKDLEIEATEREETHKKELKVAREKEAPKERNSQFGHLQEQYDELEDKYKQMEEDYQHQQEVVNDVRREVTNLLEELKDLSRKNDEMTIEKEQALDKLSAVEKESKEWQRKFEKAKTELRNLKATSSFVRQPPKLEVLGDDLLRPTEDGAISQDNVINYQVAVDDLLRSGRSEKPSSVLIAMKAVVVSCKAITEDVETYENDETKDIDADKKDRLYAMKSQFSKGLSNLMAAAKTHANGMGISPVSLLDAAATHLTSTVVELIKLFGMRNGTGSDRDSVQPEESAKQASSPPGSILRKTEPYNSYKPVNSRQENGDLPRGLHPDDLAAYLKRQTDQVVQTIQQLLAALRTPSRCEEVAPIITSIVNIVGNVSTVCKSSFNTPAGSQFRKDGEVILQDLQSTRSKLVSLRDGHFTKNPLDAPANAKKDLAKESYEVAKFTRELLGIL